MLSQFKRDSRLFIDLTRSFLREKGLLKRRPIRFRYHRTKEGVGLKLRDDVWDSAIIIETWWLNEYLRNLENIKEGATVIDIGAHIGSFSIFVASQFKNIRVLAFEPEPDNFALLKENISINHLEDRVFPFRLALDQRGGERTRLYYHPDNLGMHSLVLSHKNLPQDKRKTFFEVKTISLKEIFEENQILKCDLLKMDCEGCEYSVLLSTPGSTLRKIRNLTLEYHPGGDIRKIKQYLEGVGFKTRLGRAIPNHLIGWMINAPLLKAWRKDKEHG